MMRLRTYAAASFVGAVSIIYHAFNSRGQFYPATVYLSTSKISLALLLNMGLVIMCCVWQFIKLLFLGSLREVEVERLNDQSWREVMEILLAITIFRQEFSVSFLAMVTALLLIKALHWLAQKRVEYIETTPSVSTFSHIRIISFLGFLLFLDCIFLYSSITHLLQTRRASVSLFFSFEYMILATTTVSMFLKYVFYVCDMLMEGQWETKAVYTFYLELVRDLLHLSLYLFFFLVIFLNYGLPLHLIRDFYDTFRNFKSRVADYVRYRKITSNMNDRFPDATPEELNASDATCIICREEMVIGKKLLCGHIFHVHCLRSWLERQQTCPTCRSLVVPSNGTTGVQSELRQNGGVDGSGAAGTSAGGPVVGAVGDSLNQHQTRLQAAAAAASLYGKSYVYPSANTLTWSPGYALVPQVYVPGGPTAETYSGDNSDLRGETSANGNSEEHTSPIPNGYSNFTFPQIPHYTFIPLRLSDTNLTSGEGSNNNSYASGSSSCSFAQLEAQERFLRHQIELQYLNQHKPEDLKLASNDSISSISNHKGKSPETCASTSDCGCHGESEEVGTEWEKPSSGI